MAKTTKPGFYAVRIGRKPGVYKSWDECRAQVDGFAGGLHKKFPTLAEANAFVNGSSSSARPAQSSMNKGKSRSREEDGPVAKRQKQGNDSTSRRTTTTTMKHPDPVFGRRKPSHTPDRMVYCDGSSINNGKPNAVAGIGVFWNHQAGSRNLAERLPGPLQTNNRAEIYAVARILETDPHPEKPLLILSDSTYTIDIFSKWVDGWRRKGWKTADGKPVSNKDLILFVLSLLALRTLHSSSSSHSNSNMANVTFEKVKAHVGHEGNEMADTLANRGAMMSIAEERDFEKLARDNDRKVKEAKKKGGKGATFDEVEWAVEVDESDLLSEDEIRKLETSQNF